MNNFSFECPTKIVFGKDTIPKLSNLLPENLKILIIFGGGSVRKNGIYEQVKNALNKHNVSEFWGIEPNPKLETCLKAVNLIKRDGIDFLLSVGGGSVLDATKFIAAAAKFDGDPWDIVSKRAYFDKALPLGCVMSLPATGSEMNCVSVISNDSLKIKRSFRNELLYPKFSIIDPKTTFSLPLAQIQNGIVDTFVHILEQYATVDLNTDVQDGFCFAVIKTVIKNAKITINDPQNYDARANLCWAATCALNGWCSVGCTSDWSSHAIGHELSAVYGLDHGLSLAVVTTRLLRYNLEFKKAKLAKMGREVFGLDGDEISVAKSCIDEIENFFKSTGIATTLTELGMDKACVANLISERFKQRNLIVGEHGNIDYRAAKQILLEC
ncbi:iron-containing alcohol dehydrogenase [Campylobacter fetus]|uniref:Iron-containing alcohol dehydrogenase n=1 Tax=Campylobacter fetus TaxID=196 RepID=A0A5L4H5D2_CAMFE|nr:iron-containing alcohol dehydrogenase [Campylobacter fetus]AIR78175.1 family III metal-dependent polyol dehydrogenase [Campylobacter fetus subsp. fetus 04/554]EAI4414599.1 iron-containing alcohol dehydrogenase [Campylobacter fetus]EAJ5693293.1 iron-containing alcohol dehydrogenase [Campylobacter fetus]EAJ5703873.1 iron-containing alcohol dehydrogenase [Campylobacter fetus]EAJ9256648.1 iron-containing alcohol dehydrogenase [Campylobacter fetus]